VWPTDEALAARSGQLPRRRTTMATTSAVATTTEPTATPTESTDG
jgi:hypothetical protein